MKRYKQSQAESGRLSMTEIDTAKMNSEAPTLYLGFSNVLHHGEAFFDMHGEVTLESVGKPFGDTHHLLDALAPYPNSQIVLTTSWSWWLGDADVIALLPRALGTRVAGTTREFPPQVEEAVTGCGFVGSIIRHATANLLTRWLAIGSDFHGVPSYLMSRFLTLSASGLGASHNREALRASLESTFKE